MTTATVFADHLLWAGGVACWKGGVFVAAPPDIWYFKDTDGDHKADIKRKVFTGFGTKSQQYMLNNLKWGMDHKIYGSTAGNGGEIRPGDKPNAKPISVERHDFRFDPVTEEFEPIAGTIQFGNSFDDWGNRFMCDESEPLYQSIVDQHYLARNPVSARRPRRVQHRRRQRADLSHQPDRALAAHPLEPPHLAQHPHSRWAPASATT